MAKLSVPLLAFEFLGTLLLTFCYNVCGTYAALLVATALWSWSFSLAHFNAAVTLGDLVYKTSMRQAAGNLLLFGAVALAQFFGALAATLLTFVSSRATEIGKLRVFSPAPPLMCPGKRFQGCMENGQHGQVFLAEFLGTLAFVFSFLVIRNHKAAQLRPMRLAGPVLVGAIYEACTRMVARASSGALNPTLAVQVWVWSAGAYRNHINILNPDETEFGTYHLGRYLWAYISAPMAAAVLAGFLARLYNNQEESGDVAESEPLQNQIFSEN